MTVEEKKLVWRALARLLEAVERLDDVAEKSVLVRDFGRELWELRKLVKQKEDAA